MTTFALKRYQREALDAFEAYVAQAVTLGAGRAYQDLTGHGYNPAPFGEVPCVCLRIPTGGGKTLLAAHAIQAMARSWPIPVPRPLVLWLVPSETIRSQTLQALSTPDHPLREALARSCRASVRVYGLDDLRTLSPHDFDADAVVAVATIQSFRVEDTGQRTVYAFDEALEPHFRSVCARDLTRLANVRDAIVTPADAAVPGRGLLAAYVGRPRFSLANWIALRNPFLIVDEAHNAKTERSFEALARLNPALILELTATPLPKRANVLYHVSAQQLQAEHMIKLPIRLMEHTRGWQTAVLAAVQQQRALESDAQKEEVDGGAYIRPIVLLQAQNSTDAVNAEALRRHLIDELHIPEAHVKVATGTQRELDGVNLMATDCPVRYIVTVQALREGWDCPFAYVLCSVQSVRSATAIEQLLGRVLRMPYARKHGRDALNVAYAHVSEAQTGQAAHALADHLIDGMGFDPLDMASMVAPTVNRGLDFEELPLFAPTAPGAIPPLTVDLPPEKPLFPELDRAVSSGEALVTRDETRLRVQVRGYVEEPLLDALLGALKGKRREQVAQQVERHNALMQGAQAPANRGETFPPIPKLCYRTSQGELLLLEREAVTDALRVDLLATPVDLPSLGKVEQTVRGWDIYLDGKRIHVGATQAQLEIDMVRSPLTSEDLVRSLSRAIHDPRHNLAPGVVPAALRRFVEVCVNHYVREQRLSIEALAHRHQDVARAITARIHGIHESAAVGAFRQAVLERGWDLVLDPSRVFDFAASGYAVPAHRRYAGKHRFRKHHFAVIANLKDGGEEFDCAMAIDEHPKVRRWVRNLESDPAVGFCLPTSHQNFYPDFVCETVDGRWLIVEYKGAFYASTAKEIEKKHVGEVWAQTDPERCVFAWIVKEASRPSITAQLDACISPVK